MNLYDALTSAIYMSKLTLNGGTVDDDDKRIRASGLYEGWTLGSYQVGDIRNANGQTWECFQAHDNAIYPDINPDNSAWYTFWRPLHGKSPETARPYTPVQGAHDMYHAGEYMIYTDGKTYRCTQDTAYSPEDYAQAWEVYTEAEEPEEPSPEPEEPTGYPEWVQPTGAHDAYGVGDKVTYNGQHYVSKIDGNVWSPDAYPAGWEAV